MSRKHNCKYLLVEVTRLGYTYRETFFGTLPTACESILDVLVHTQCTQVLTFGLAIFDMPAGVAGSLFTYIQMHSLYDV